MSPTPCRPGKPLVGKRVQAAAINFPAPPNVRNAEVTGVPVRQEFFSLAAPAAAPHLLVSAARRERIFNMNLPHIIKSLLEAVPVSRSCTRAESATLKATHAAYAASAPTKRWVVRLSSTRWRRICRAHLIMSLQCVNHRGRGGCGGQARIAVPFAAATDEHQRRTPRLW